MTDAELQLKELKEIQDVTDLDAFSLILDLAREYAKRYPRKVGKLRLVKGGRDLSGAG